ncbi:PHA/PHB synthase family protein [Sphingomonas morindae]|uniref:Alpha/beta fold hydrolase n=1 Tax=Sphingomonas morindae TaxID=1541170 RepID=A0ABY4X9X1_9SPHN|nr:alpha/beta fold hydrolase [Sphingomonas morindae]USI73753.1 alpha/beta fold hydrolase [Sphingomonas morindae]
MPDPQTAPSSAPLATPSLEELQHWTGVIGRAQQMLLDYATEQAGRGAAAPALAQAGEALFARWAPAAAPHFDSARLAETQQRFWQGATHLWEALLDPAVATLPARPDDPAAWRAHPGFALIEQAHGLLAGALADQVEALEGLDAKQKDQLRFATEALREALAPTNFVATNPQALARMIETKGESLLAGLDHMLADLRRGQLTHSPGVFELGRDIAATPGAVIYETPLFQLIHYAPATARVGAAPLLIFPPWINRFYILDLGPKKSFVRWAVAEGLSVFLVSWKSADADLAETRLDDYVAAQLDALRVVRAALAAERVHLVGYCVAGTVLATTLALLAARDEAAQVASATFFTAQVDFSQAGELSLFVDDAMLQLIGALGEPGYLDGRYMAATFNLLRGRDLIWSHVVNSYLLGEEGRPFDLLHWNGDVTNLPARWHLDYLRDFYRDNLLVRPGALTVLGVPIDLGRVTTPAYVQAGRQDHIAPAESVWKLTEHFAGPLRFVLAGSGHIAGVVNPPEAQKYQYWTVDEPATDFADFLARARETKGSWWPDWRAWIAQQDGETVPATGARVPGAGPFPAIEPAPGRYVRMR